MIKNLIYKEIHLNINPWSYLFAAAIFLLLVPDWPFFIVPAYLYFFFMLIGQFDKTNQDLIFASLLPVPKAGIVTARTYTMVAVELAMLALAAPVAVGRYLMYSAGNQAGMNVNLAFFGLMLVQYAVFNLIYLPGSYKQAYRMLWPILGGTLISVAVGGGLTTAVSAVPALATLFNDRGLGHAGDQAIVFIAGLLIYVGVAILAHRQAVVNFAKVDL